MASRHLLMQLSWTPTIPNSAGMAPWPLHCLILISAWPPDLVTEQEGFFCRSLACWPFPVQLASGFLAGCRAEQVLPSPTVLCSLILSAPNLGQPPHQHCKGLCESHGEGQKIYLNQSHAFHSHIPPGRVGARILGEAAPCLLASSATAQRPSWLPSTCLPPACKPRGSVQGVTGELAAAQLWHPLALLLNQALCAPCLCHDEAADIKEK